MIKDETERFIEAIRETRPNIEAIHSPERAAGQTPVMFYSIFISYTGLSLAEINSDQFEENLFLRGVESLFDPLKEGKVFVDFYFTSSEPYTHEGEAGRLFTGASRMLDETDWNEEMREIMMEEQK